MRFPVSLTAIVLWLVGLSLAGASPRADATVRDFYFKRLGTEQGLVQNTITALAEDAQGFVWVGTQGGLHRYDGVRFSAYRHDPNDPSSLPDSFVTALDVEPRVALWIGTYSQYVVRLDLRTGAFRRYPPAAGDASRHVRSLLVADGQVWVGTGGGLERLDPGTGKRVRVVRLAGAGAPGQALVRDGRGRVWFGSSAGLYRVDGSGGSTRIGGARPVTALLVDAADRLWVGRSDGLYRLAVDGRTLQHAWPATGLAGAGVRALVQAPDGRLWVSLAGEGLLRFDPRSGTAQRIRENAAVAGSLPESSIGTLLVDRSGQLWVGGQIRGVAVTDPEGARFSYLVDAAPASPVAASSVRAVIEGDDGALWVGTDAGLLLHHALDGAGFQDAGALLPPRWHEADGALAGARIMGFERAGPHRLWMATTRGLLLLDTRARRVSRIEPTNRVMPGLRSIDRARDGTLWLGSNGDGLFRFRPDIGLLQEVAAGADTSDGLVHAVDVDRLGRVWFATSDGLGLHDPATHRTRRFRHGIDAPASLAGDLVRALHEAADGTLWVGSHSGLSRVRESSAGIAFDHPLAPSLEDRATPTVYSIVESPTGTLWLGTNNGILRFEPGAGDGRGRVRHYGLSDGLQDVEFNGGAATVLADGRVALGGVNGLNLFDPARIDENDYDAPLRLLGVRIGADAPRDGTVLWQPEQLVVPGDADLVRLRVGALDHAAASPIRYRYRMHGLHEDWIDNGTLNDITYTGLPAGTYALQVQATGRDGAWNPDGLALPVVVQPPAWRQPWYLVAYVLGVLLLAAILARAWLRRRARERGYFRQIREREERLKLALWASGEQFWDYDLVRGALHWMRGDDSAGPIPTSAR